MENVPGAEPCAMDLTGLRSPTTFDNVWDIDCSIFFPPTVEGRQIHSAFFDTGDTLMRELLRGIDRTVLATDDWRIKIPPVVRVCFRCGTSRFRVATSDLASMRRILVL